MKCIETRLTPEGFKRRRYVNNDGSRHTTYEVPATVLKTLGRRRMAEAMETWVRGQDARKAVRERHEKIVAMLADGAKPTAVAHEVGVSDERVRQIRKQIALERGDL